MPAANSPTENAKPLRERIRLCRRLSRCRDTGDDREALRAIFRAALEVIQREGLTIPGRRGEAQVAHPLLRFLAPWLSAIEKADDAPDADAGTAQLLALASKVTGVPTA
jgi:hypothetical protein